VVNILEGKLDSKIPIFPKFLAKHFSAGLGKAVELEDIWVPGHRLHNTNLLTESLYQFFKHCIVLSK